MDDNKISGMTNGPIGERAGRVTSDVEMRIRERFDETAGTTQETVVTLDEWLRDAIEAQPYRTAIVALGIGWLLGRLHKPL
jgi:ElaB/YqjD/DUF883 family membrane-anchored ribosome-binding protein